MIYSTFTDCSYKIFLFLFIILFLIKSGYSDNVDDDELSETTESSLIELSSKLVNVNRDCTVSEFKCLNGGCVSLDKYCNGNYDCADNSDEPKSCSLCNRTYHGDVGKTYEFEVRRPREDQLPFICHLNFTALGGNHGDFVQLTFDTFTIGKFVSFTSEGCPDGYMTIIERSPQPPMGQWCGSAWGYTVYFSETDSINMTLRLERLTQQGVGYNFEFKLAYKFLTRNEARLRYGNMTLPAWRGELIKGTYCDRLLRDCHLRPCRIQSPNFPGVYPRNASCTYKIEHNKVPPGQHALIAVRQTNSHKIHIKDQIIKYDRSQRVLKLWDQCNVVQDYLTVWDGPTKDSPLLVRLCGGDSIPDIVARGPNMLLEFHTSPFDNPFHPVPLSYLPGFELEVQVLFVERDSHSYVREDGKCNFVLSAFDTSSGVLRNPRHSLPPNTTCAYHFQGRSNEVVWISFIKYHVAGAEPSAFDQNKDCSSELSIWDGEPNSSDTKANGTLLGSFCREESPRLCDHALLSNATRATRPCTSAESYITKSSTLTLLQELRQGSALYPVSFVLRYEFVDISEQGQPTYERNNLCDRAFLSSNRVLGSFRSPRSIFYYGRGGSQNVTCTLRFEAAPGERVQITFKKMVFGKRRCRGNTDPRSGRWKCDRFGVSPIAQVDIVEEPWEKILIRRDCLCSNRNEPLTLRTLTAPIVNIQFTVTMMNITEDFDDFNFEGDYKFIPIDSNDESICSNSWGNRLANGPSGTLILREKSDSELSSMEVTVDDNVISESVRAPHCVHRPWMIEPKDGSHLYVWLKGRDISGATQFCSTTNRILLYSASNTSIVREICPSSDDSTVHAWSAGWEESLNSEVLLGPHARGIIIEFLQREPAEYTVHWIEVTKPTMIEDVPNAFSLVDCHYKCPEINACISSLLWCDGTEHCPSGFDESDENCAIGFIKLSPTYAGAAAAAVAVLLATMLAVCARKCRRKSQPRDEVKSREDGVEKALPPIPNRGEFATVQKYASIDRYGLKYSAGLNDARYYDELRKDKLDCRSRALDDALC